MDRTNRETAAAIYERLKSGRQPYITRAEKCAKLTIPALFPEESANGSTDFPAPYQGVGARGVKSLGAKLALAMMPPNESFCRFGATPRAKSEAESEVGPDAGIKIEEVLADLERRLVRYAESRQIRVTIDETMKQLLIAGNGLLFLPPREGGIKLYRLNSYVCQRDPLGTVFNIITLDRTTFAALPKRLQGIVQKSGEKKPEEVIEIYTHIQLIGEKMVSYQEINGAIIPGSAQKFPVATSPWIALRLYKVDGESYGRSYCEEHYGDLTSLERLSKAIVEAAAIAAHIIFLVNPNGYTNPRVLAKVPTGTFVSGRKADIEALTLDKYADMATAEKKEAKLEASLAYVFLLHSAVQRDGERVTAEEIRYLARELDDGLGGIYSILTQELQLPLARCMIAQLQRMGDFPEFPEGTVDLQITTGFAALGRGHDYDKTLNFVQTAIAIPGADKYLKTGGLLSALGSASAVDTKGLIKTDEEVAQEAQAEREMRLAEKAAPQAVTGAMAQMNQQQGG